MTTGTMWALVKDQPEVGLTMKRVEIPAVGSNDVMIKIHKTAICGTDVHIWDWNEWAQNTIRLGTTAGHEYVGHIVEMGANVKGHYIGELVSGEGHIVCGMCRNCRSGRGHLCKGTQGVGVNRDGAFAEYLVIPASNVISCSPNIPEELYSIFDPFGNATHTALSFNLLAEDVLVTGAGPIGILAAAIAKFSGARHVVITDLNEYRLNLARQFGVTAVNTRTTDLKEVMSQLEIHEGFDVGMEMSGSPMALRQLIDSMYNGGHIALLGLPSKNAVELPLNTIIWNGLTLKGIYGREMFETWYKMQAMVEGGFPLDKIITHRYPIADFRQGFEAMRSGSSGKVILDWKDI
ncbi:MAG: L-threonine 3-dehydrogenase [Candidatus Faecousia sp.]|nr:L-threonine 3-dehydrogenase [Clostridiales bacterium]MDY4220023.1 L-threonine 3-dehydrogenase [Candidatus Faecousia sp.]